MKTRSLKGVKGIVVAAGVLSLLATGYGLAGTSTGEEKGEDAKMVKCYGINSCSGKGECGAPDGSHDCAGKNSCEGKGWVKTTAADCEEQGGEILEDKKKDDEGR
jgi:hypothetical protein